MRKSNRGMALVVTMVTLAVTLMLGMSSFNSALLGERMAGNYRASIQAYSEAEAGIAKAADLLRNPDQGFTYESLTGEEALEAFLSDIENKNQIDLSSLQGKLTDLGGYTLSVDPTSIESLSDGVAFRLNSDGSYGAADNRAQRRLAGLFFTARGHEGPLGMTACEGLTLSGTIDSYDSSLGAYGDGNALRSKATIQTLLDGAPVTMNSAPIYGSVKAAGDLAMGGTGAAIIGNLVANGNVTIEGSDWRNEKTGEYGHVFGTTDVVGNITVSGTLQGNVRANEAINFTNNSKINGDATSPVMTHGDSTTLEDHVSGSISQVDPGVAGVESVATPEECSDFDVPEYRDKFAGVGSSCPDSNTSCDLVVEGSAPDVTFTASGIVDPDGGTYPASSQTINGRDLSVVRFDSFSQKGQRNFIIGEPDKPIDAVIVVDGPASLEGQGLFRVSEGSTLQIVTSGEFYSSKGNVIVGDEMPSKVVNGTVTPILSVLSTYQDKGNKEAGVQIKSDSAFHGLVAAPFSKVDIAGAGGVYGALHAREASITGGGGFHYDERLGQTPALDGSSGGGGKPLLVGMP